MSAISGTLLQGHVEEGWGNVADAFLGNFEGEPGEVGAACCVYVDGRPVVDVWGGLADRHANRPWDKDTIINVASTAKGAVAICAHMLVQRGELDLDAPVAKYWPEFGAAGKEHIPVRLLLSHQAGLPVVDGPLTFEDACAWEPVIRALEVQKPEWEPGTEHVYHAITFMYLIGELVRRVSGRSIGTFFAEEVAAPLGLHAWLGLPEEQEANLARLEWAAPSPLEDMTASMIEASGLDEATVNAWVDAVWGPDSIMARAAKLGGAFARPEDFDSRAARAAEFSLFATASSLARMYAATVSDVDGVRLLNPETVDRMVVIQTDKTRMHGLPPELNVPAERSFNMSLGFWRSGPSQPMAGPRSFGHPGSGGSVGFGDADGRVGFGYIMNLWSYRVGVRARKLAAAVAASLGEEV